MRVWLLQFQVRCFLGSVRAKLSSSDLQFGLKAGRARYLGPPFGIGEPPSQGKPRWAEAWVTFSIGRKVRVDPVARTESTLDMRFAMSYSISQTPQGWMVRLDLVGSGVAKGRLMKDRLAALQKEIEESIACS